MKQLALAVANYHDIHNQYPPAVTYGADGKTGHSWRILLLPFLDHKPLYDRYSFDEPWNGPNNAKLATEMPELFAFAGTYEPDKSTGTNFVAVTGPETVWPSDGTMGYLQVGDPHSMTIQFAEYNGPPIHWMSPDDLNFETMSFVPGDPAGIDSQYLQPAVAMVDGSVKRMTDEVTPEQVRAMCTANGNDAGPVDKHVQEMEDARLRELKASQKARQM
ncbi:MAG: DUF1559 domain-containing protein [Planctomycetaceae bacterium]